MGDFIGLEATVKSAEHFPDEPGNWAYFSFSNPEGEMKKQAEAFPAASCNSCHQAAAAADWVFTQYYPVLRDAKGSKKGAWACRYIFPKSFPGEESCAILQVP